ncbi:MAG TPA: hypothetical protein VMT19_04465 [Thermoanaerobaculaceae bacterium]|nr:hypothetical protein [Thermoanaerobaculaceae bacterium]
MSLAVAVPAGFGVLLGGAAFAFLWLDRHDRDLVPWLVGTALWGFAFPAALALAGTRLPQLLAEPAAGDAVPELWVAGPALAAAVPLLGLALPVVLVARSRALEGPSGGLVFGICAGLAFSFGMHVLVVVRGTWQPAAGALVFMSLLHAAAGAVLGAGVGWAKLSAPRGMRVPAVAGAIVAAAALGVVLVAAAAACWRRWGGGSDLCNLALAAADVGVLAGAIAFSLALERKVLATQLAEEVGLGVLPEWVADILPSYRRRVRSDWWARRDERREIVRLLLGLAFRKRRLRSLPEERARLYGLEVGRLRQRARVLLALSPAPLAGAQAAE